MGEAGALTFGTVCSGIGAPEVAWGRLGWRSRWCCEISAFPSRVLAHHSPEVPNHNDLEALARGEVELEPIDVLIGGTPCQSFSVAGLRGGLADPRGNLALAFLQVVGRIRPRWVVWENVPGVLSSGGGRDFGSILGGLGELGYGWAYRVLDAQYFGVAQRRRRVFVVGYAGGESGAAAVLFERACLLGDSPPSRAAREEVAGTLGGGSSARGWNDDLDRAGAFIPERIGALTARGCYALGAPEVDAGTFVPWRPAAAWVPCPCGAEFFCSIHQEHASVCPCPPVEEWKASPYLLPEHLDVAHTLRGEGFDASEGGTGRGTPLVPVLYDETQITSVENRSNPQPGAPAHGLTKDGAARGLLVGGALSVAIRGREEGSAAELGGPRANALRAANGGSSREHVLAAMRVRRLTPRECERLQGFPDDYTAIPGAADGPRYMALGNSMAVPVIEWLGRRIAMVERALEAA